MANRTKVFDRDATPANRGPFSFELLDTAAPFTVRANGSLVLARRPSRNATYQVRVRVHDSGSPRLAADSHLTIKVTDESSNEPHVLDQTVEVTTLEGWAPMGMGDLLGQVRVSDPDAQDVLLRPGRAGRASLQA
jgi:hypothetical protein